ncbi:hypothetical protein CO112_01120 [Candidatus Dojkabacteria bacterium CG_4_9_14_3_um_filter_150_Dojkabacteria_WS6_41_13]|nr:MAG: hypothetical protein CO112_01120 [Candidatus Dojkabacteria bacterium CG_4_9_14_3_um_filter_150_Dojkabacteria_WS6_41_13]
MNLTILGSGTFFVGKTVTASSFLFETSTKKILIDCGPGTLVKLAQAGYKPEDLDYVFITHFHPDHTSDLFPLFMNYRLKDNFEPGSVTKFPTFYGPEGLDKFLSDYSHLTELHAYDGWGKIKVIDYTPVIQLDDFAVKTYKVVHTAFSYATKAYSLRFEVENKVISFSGDTAACSGVENASENADVFVCDTSYPKGKVNTVHLNSAEIGEISTKSKVKKLILDHFYPQYDQDTLVSEVRENYKDEVLKAKDLDTIEL